MADKRPSAAEIAQIKEHFKRHDLDNDGTITPPEFNKMLKRMGVLLTPSDEQKLFKAIDQDGNGKIDVAEFIDHYSTILALERRAEEKQMEHLRSKTSFSAEEIKAMYTNFKRVAASQNDDGVMDKLEFRHMMLDGQMDASRNTVFYDGLFRMFDRDGSGDIDFSEFVSALAMYYGKSLNAQPEEKAKFFFSIYDVDGDTFISKEDLRRILADCLAANEVVLTDENVDRLVEATFQKFPSCCASGKIDFATYKTIAARKPP